MNAIFYILWKKSRLKSTFLPYHVKKHNSTLEMDTSKIMLLLSYLASLDNKGVKNGQKLGKVVYEFILKW